METPVLEIVLLQPKRRGSLRNTTNKTEIYAQAYAIFS